MTSTAAGSPDRLTNRGRQLSEAQRADLVAATRELISAVSLTDVSAAELSAAAAQIRRMTADLTTATRSRVVRVPLPPGPLQGEVTGTADPVLGRFNPVAPPLRVTVDETGASASLVPAATFEGPPGAVHGGYTAMLLDAIMGILVRSLGISAVTATLSLKYLRPTPLDQRLQLGSRVLSQGERKVTVEGVISAGGVETVRATGLFVSPSTWTY